MAEFVQKDQCLMALRDLTRELGRPVQSKDLQRRHAIYESILHHFGSLHKARRAAGLRGPEPRRRWSLDMVAKEIRRLHARGIPILVWSLIEHGRRDLVNAARFYCGGIPLARHLAGVPDPQRRKGDREPWDPERVVEEIRDLHDRGESVAYTRVSRKLECAGRYYFGSWGAAIEAAGLDYDAIRLLREPYTRDDLLRELRAVREEQPGMTLGELHKHRIAEPCIYEFGSLEAAARAAGLDHWPLRIIGPLLRKTATRAATGRTTDHRERPGTR